ncbi:hypothetical protein CBR_g27774 [Chara braunii]|uniref:Uncharacterized protein n=1 Tax=Chara braunii TaxID=69332 RepID=A0A388L8E8_CHABU|nr:hypothetical protein CBR_g27774 [Chara braunii]|eukprot:GBG78548.1 hypothetical protein CBR_g27774 [Chara braunii]
MALTNEGPPLTDGQDRTKAFWRKMGLDPEELLHGVDHLIWMSTYEAFDNFERALVYELSPKTEEDEARIRQAVQDVCDPEELKLERALGLMRQYAMRNVFYVPDELHLPDGDDGLEGRDSTSPSAHVANAGETLSIQGARAATVNDSLDEEYAQAEKLLNEELIALRQRLARAYKRNAALQRSLSEGEASIQSFRPLVEDLQSTVPKLREQGARTLSAMRTKLRELQAYQDTARTLLIGKKIKQREGPLLGGGVDDLLAGLTAHKHDGPFRLLPSSIK